MFNEEHIVETASISGGVPWHRRLATGMPCPSPRGHGPMGPMGPMGSGPLGPWEGLGAPGCLVVIVLLVLQFLDDFWRRRFDS